jgi:NAD(P)-dependent dehydrogenase (short-subunit alcohol dehydrogenase family)
MASITKPFTQAFAHASTPSLISKRYLVTGGTNGIGLSLSRTLYAHGASLHIISASKETADKALAYIKTGDLKLAPDDYQAGFGRQEDLSGAGGKESGEVEWIECDLEDLKQVAEVAKSLSQKLDRLDGFIGIAGKGVNEFKFTKDGFE